MDVSTEDKYLVAGYSQLCVGVGVKGVPGDPTYFKRREFCFTLEGDIFVRYKSYQVLHFLISILQLQPV